MTLFQPISWAFTTSTESEVMVISDQHGMEQPDHPDLVEYTQGKASDSPAHFLMAHMDCDNMTDVMQDQCLINCLTICSVSVGAVVPVIDYQHEQFKNITSRTTSTIFTSYTESPEIQPPLDIRT